VILVTLSEALYPQYYYENVASVWLNTPGVACLPVYLSADRQVRR